MIVAGVNTTDTMMPLLPYTGRSSSSGTNELTEEEKRQVEKLKKRDQEVRQHERAHLSAAGDLAVSSASYNYQTGPDGKRYAVGGEVSIDVSPEDKPEDTIEKARKIRRAALAPAEPSAKDRQIAAQAARMEAQARAQLNKENQNNMPGMMPDAMNRNSGFYNSTAGLIPDTPPTTFNLSA